MPLYEYRCKKCGYEFEAIRKFSDGPLRKAPDCPKDRTCKLEKLVSASAFHLKGGGWYSDGYGDGAGKADTSTASDKPGTSDKPGKSDKGGSKKESKPAKKDSGTKSVA